MLGENNKHILLLGSQWIQHAWVITSTVVKQWYICSVLPLRWKKRSSISWAMKAASARYYRFQKDGNGVLPSSGLVHFSGSTRSIWIHLLHLQMGVNPLPRSAILNKWAALTKETRNLHNSLLSHYILATQKKAYIKIKQVEIRNKSQISTGDKINSHLINDQVFKFRSIA